MDLLCSQERLRIKDNIIVYYDKGFTLVSPIGEGRAEQEHNTSTEGPALNSKYKCVFIIQCRAPCGCAALTGNQRG